MSTLDTKPNTTDQTPKTGTAPAQAVEQAAETAALITEQQVLFASAAVLAPAPARHLGVAYGLASAVRAMFTWPETRPVPRHYPQRFVYLESSAMSREMDRL